MLQPLTSTRVARSRSSGRTQSIGPRARDWAQYPRGAIAHGCLELHSSDDATIVPMRFLILLIPGLAAAVTVSTNFEGGSLGRIEKVSETYFRLGAKGEKDQDGRNRQANWYYFRVDSAGTKELTLDIVDLPGEYNYLPNQGAITKDTPPVISYDRRDRKS